MGRRAARAGIGTARQSSGSPQKLPVDGHSQLARCPRGLSPLPAASLGAVTDPSTGLGLEQGGQRGLRCRKMQTFINSGLPRKERCPLEGATRANSLPGQTGMTGVVTSGLCQPFNGARLLEQRWMDERNFSFSQIICKTQA